MRANPTLCSDAIEDPPGEINVRGSTVGFMDTSVVNEEAKLNCSSSRSEMNFTASRVPNSHFQLQSSSVNNLYARLD